MSQKARRRERKVDPIRLTTGVMRRAVLGFEEPPIPPVLYLEGRLGVRLLVMPELDFDDVDDVHGRLYRLGALYGLGLDAKIITAAINCYSLVGEGNPWPHVYPRSETAGLENSIIVFEVDDKGIRRVARQAYTGKRFERAEIADRRPGAAFPVTPLFSFFIAKLRAEDDMKTRGMDVEVSRIAAIEVADEMSGLGVTAAVSEGEE